MKWTDKAIVDWHKKTFPLCTIEEQAQKVKEEIQEVIKTLVNDEGMDRYIEEVADVYIASLVLKQRFGVDLHLPISEAIEKKMEVNCQREWEKVDGVYRHKKVLTRIKNSV